MITPYAGGQIPKSGHEKQKSCITSIHAANSLDIAFTENNNIGGSHWALIRGTSHSKLNNAYWKKHFKYYKPDPFGVSLSLEMQKKPCTDLRPKSSSRSWRISRARMCMLILAPGKYQCTVCVCRLAYSEHFGK